MYTAFYGLREKPFALSPDPRFLFLSESHREALAHLLYGIEQGEGFIAITGEVGTGKTTLCRSLLRRLGPDVEVAFLFNPRLDAEELIRAIHVELGIESLGETLRELMDELNRFLLEKQIEGRRVLLVIDEAQGLAPETLEQVRLLSNLETESQKLIQILLLGQPELDEMLGSPSLRQLRQRIGVRWRLGPLRPAETRAYVRHRLRVAARGDRELFTGGALRAVHRGSGGIPRLVNLLCDRALLAAYAARSSGVRAGHVRKAHRELRRGAASASRGRRARTRLGWSVAAGAVLIAAGGIGLGWGAEGRLSSLLGALHGAGGASRPRADVAPPDPRLGGHADEPASGAGPVEAALAPVATAPRVPEPGPDAATAPGEIVSDPGSPDPIGSGDIGLPSLEAGGDAGAPVDLAARLARELPGAAAETALRAVLEAWSLPPPSSLPTVLSPEAVLEALGARQLRIQPLRGTDLATLRALDHPALLVLRAADGAERLVTLRALDGDRALVAGIVPEGSLWVERVELAPLWDGAAYVVWQDFEGLPEVVQRGDSGAAVAWLQLSLRELGYYAGALSARFDATTRDAVRGFQQARGLSPDGAVGPLTQMALYDALPRYRTPRLAALGGAG